MQLDSKPGPRSQDASPSFNFGFGDRSTFMIKPPSERKSLDRVLLPNLLKINPSPSA